MSTARHTAREFTPLPLAWRLLVVSRMLATLETVLAFTLIGTTILRLFKPVEEVE